MQLSVSVRGKRTEGDIATVPCRSLCGGRSEFGALRRIATELARAVQVVENLEIYASTAEAVPNSELRP